MRYHKWLKEFGILSENKPRCKETKQNEISYGPKAVVCVAMKQGRSCFHYIIHPLPNTNTTKTSQPSNIKLPYITFIQQNNNQNSWGKKKI